ncbi:MAG: hypothetical protein JWM47_2480 [Acidimicrobiales bacterium]|nr:hypothetical protein [Acidimicrobiales bacterium]
MPLFDLSGETPRPFRRLNSTAEYYEKEIEDLFWGDLEAFAGEPLFAVARQPRLVGGGIPDIVAIDSTGHIVVIEVKRDVDRAHLAQCLEYAGWARRATMGELADLYRSGPHRFFADWQTFTATTEPLPLDRSPRLILVARSFDGRTESAFGFLTDSNVPVKLIRIVFYEDADGKRIVDVDSGLAAGDRTSTPDPTPRPDRAPSVRRRSVSGVTVADLLEAGLMEVGEKVEWVRPLVGETHHAVIDSRGAFVLEDGRVFNTPSRAADELSGGSNNGWECWIVPRLSTRLGLLRAKVSENR